MRLVCHACVDKVIVVVYVMAGAGVSQACQQSRPVPCVLPFLASVIELSPAAPLLQLKPAHCCHCCR